jgi:RHS repeat-associated protein
LTLLGRFASSTRSTFLRTESIDRASDKVVWNWFLVGSDEKGVVHERHIVSVRVAKGDRYVFDMRFPGQRFDAVTGLFQNGWRDYDPTSGRYVQSDPIGLAGGISTYGYVGSNPYMRVDPHGLDDSQCMYNPGACGWSRNPQESNVNVGVGAWGNLLAGFGGAETGAAMDSTGKFCLYHQVCRGVVAGLPVQGEVGLALGVGTGSIGLGTQTTYGTVVIGGAGVAGGGQVLGKKSGISASRGMLGWGGSPEGCAAGIAAVQCKTEYYWCSRK